MVKDKKNAFLDLLKITIDLIKKSCAQVNKILIHIDKFDPSGNMRKRVVSGAFLIIFALYAIFYSKDLESFCNVLKTKINALSFLN